VLSDQRFPHENIRIHGSAYIGYIPHEHIIGISKLTRLVRLFARHFAVQERLGEQIVDTFDTMLQPHGVAVYCVFRQKCLQLFLTSSDKSAHMF
jgi:GTP cyclohydrolase IA